MSSSYTSFVLLPLRLFDANNYKTYHCWYDHDHQHPACECKCDVTKIEKSRSGQTRTAPCWPYNFFFQFKNPKSEMRTFWGCSCPLSFTVFTKWSYSFDSCKVPILCFCQRIWRWNQTQRKAWKKEEMLLVTWWIHRVVLCERGGLIWCFNLLGLMCFPFSCHVNQCKKKRNPL